MTPTDCDADAMRALLKYCYLGKLGAVSEATLDTLYMAAQYLGMKELGVMCLSHKQRLKKLVTSKSPAARAPPSDDEQVTLKLEGGMKELIHLKPARQSKLSSITLDDLHVVIENEPVQDCNVSPAGEYLPTTVASHRRQGCS